MNEPYVPFPSMSSTFSLIEPFLPCSCDASHCLASPGLLEPSSQACLDNPKLGVPILHSMTLDVSQLLTHQLSILIMH
jgi:hypothetical protein